MAGISKGAQTRSRVLEAVVAAVARDGIAQLSVAGIGSEVGMSSGHVLYHFKTKDALFVEALRYVEASLDEPRAALASLPVKERLERYVELYLPTDRSDARWSLWVQVWGTSVTDADLRAAQLELDAKWQFDLARLIADGVASGDFGPASVAVAVDAIAGILDGLAIRLMTGDDDDGETTRKVALAAVQSLLS